MAGLHYSVAGLHYSVAGSHEVVPVAGLHYEVAPVAGLHYEVSPWWDYTTGFRSMQVTNQIAELRCTIV